MSIWASEERSSFHAYVFLKEVLKYCENGSVQMAFKRLGLKYEHETFGEVLLKDSFRLRREQRLE